MQVLTSRELNALFHGPFKEYREEPWAVDWRRSYADQIRTVQNADASMWRASNFQQKLWDSAAVASIGPGQSVTVVGAYTDWELADRLFDARQMLEGLPVDVRGTRLQALYDEVLAWVYPLYTRRRPKARLVRLLAAMFPRDMTCLMDAARIPGVQRLIGTERVPGNFVAQHPMIRDRIREVVGPDDSVEAQVDQSIFTWFLWQTQVDRQDEGAVPVQSRHREAHALPPLSLLPPHAQRRSLACVRDNVALLMAMVREAEQGITREDLVGVILTEATQLNASSAANIISQAMGGLGLIRLEGNAYRPTERGHELLNSGDPAPVLRAPLVGRVFGMGHLLLMIDREPGKLKPSDAAKRLQDLVPTWTSLQPGSHIVTWARLTGLAQLDGGPGGGGLVLTDDGADYLAALPQDFEDRWRVESVAGANFDDDGVQPEPVASPGQVSPYSASDIVAEGCFLSEPDVVAAVELVRRKKNLILQGPPGTGKTWLAKRIGYALIGSSDPERLMAVQFQPSLSYEDFVRGWRPDGKGGLTLADGAFLDAVAAARDDRERPFVLVIEEINRGNPAQIFGELLTLIEDTKRRPEEALRLAYPRTLDERIHIPDNLYLIGTMNLADRSLALVDLALRRRFAFLTLQPQFGPEWRSWCLDRGAPAELVEIIAERLLALNEAIEVDRTLGRQFQIGHSFVTPTAAPGPSAEAWRDWYRKTVETEIGPLLFEYWYDDAATAKAQISKLQLEG